MVTKDELKTVIEGELLMRLGEEHKKVVSFEWKFNSQTKLQFDQQKLFSHFFVFYWSTIDEAKIIWKKTSIARNTLKNFALEAKN